MVKVLSGFAAYVVGLVYYVVSVGVCFLRSGWISLLRVVLGDFVFSLLEHF